MAERAPRVRRARGALLAEPKPVRVLEIDQTRRGKPRWEHCAETGRWLRVDPWDTGFVDLDGSQGLLGQRIGRTGAAVIGGLSERTPEFRKARSSWRLTRTAVYASALGTPGLLPNATIVVDHFHLKLANDALSRVRRRVTWDLRQRRGPQCRPGVGEPAPAYRARTVARQQLRKDVESDPG